MSGTQQMTLYSPGSRCVVKLTCRPAFMPVMLATMRPGGGPPSPASIHSRNSSTDLPGSVWMITMSCTCGPAFSTRKVTSPLGTALENPNA